MNAELLIDSEYGKGSTFSFEIVQKVLPDIDLTIADVMGEETTIKKVEKPQIKNFDGKSILVVDDTMLNRKVIHEMLKATNISYFEASGGEEGLEIIMKRQFDIILLDHMMPDINGLDVFKTMKETDHPNQNTPVVMLTANVVDDAQSHYMEMGFDGFLSKPLKVDDLYSMLNKFLGN